ncbi:MAG TPA: carboxypeptidase regulatory-like domain-containing protein [Vicinamibacterales bacterium]|nr:carboxypeptidase regulatory-like domain-containing protein [Vicinamibacterales bacterium]
MSKTKRLCCTCVALLAAALIPTVAAAQTGSIAGVVKDSSGAVMPGVVVEAASPALIEKVRTATTDEKGQYKIVDLRPGIYTVTFTLTGFNIYKREGIELTTQFTAPVNAELKVGAITETVTVTGESPVVDTQRIQQVKVMTRDVIDAVPTGKTFQNVGVLVPGVTVAAGGTGATPYDVGGSSGEQQVQMAIHGGSTADMVVQMDGMRFNNLCGSGSYTGISGNDGAVEQIAFETGAISAEMGTGGIRVNMIPKEGGNTFKGFFFVNGANDSFQSDNFAQSLKDQGLAAVNRVKRVWDINGSLGGPIKKNTLWFYFASRYWGLDKFPADSFYNADPRYYAYSPDKTKQGVDDTWNKSNSTRLTWQASARNKFTAFVDLQDRLTGHWFVGQGGIFGITTPEASWVQTTPIGHLIQTKYTSTLSGKLLVEAGMSVYDQEYTRLPQDGITSSTLSVRDNATGRRINAAPYYSEHFSVLRAYAASLSYVTGSHAAKVGMTMSEGPRHEIARVNGDMTLVFNTSTTNCLPGEAVPCSAPIQAILTASPRDAHERLNADLGVYAQDQWTIDRFTINAGLRFDYLNAKLEAQDFPAGTFVPARHTDEIPNLPSWKDLNPRLGLSWDVRGDGKTAVKTTLSRYVASQTVGFASQFNPLGGTVTGAGFSGTGADTRVWTDPNRDRVVQLSELGPSGNPFFGTNFLATTPAPDVATGWFHRGYNWEYSASVQHELLPRVAVSAAYFRRSFGNFTHTNALSVVPNDYSPFCITAPTDSRLPLSGQAICGLYDVSVAARGNLSINRLVEFADPSKRSQVFNGVDLTISARKNNLLLAGGTGSGKTRTVNCETFNSPDVRFCDNSTPMLTQLKLLASYTLPYDVQISGTFQSIPGPALAANWNISSTIANAGPQPLNRSLSAGAATVALMEPNTVFGDRLNQFDMRFARLFRKDKYRFQVMADVYNVFNAAPVLSYNTTFSTAATSEWLHPTDVLQGRLVKIGAQFTF